MSRMGSEISRLRKEIGMTQKQLAKLSGVTEGFIAEVEVGRKVLNGELITRISKVLNKEVDKLDLYEVEEKIRKPEPDKNVVKVIEKPVQEVWNEALAGVLMAVPVYNYVMEEILETRQLPIISNKVEGFSKDKVFYLEIQDNEMIGFRISQKDRVLCFSTQDIDTDAIFFIECNGTRVVRQIKRLDKDKLLLVSNSGSLKTETILKKDIKILARLVRLEVML